MRRRRRTPRLKCQAFTLIELLCVMVIVAVVSAFVFAAGTSANQRAMSARATAELASLGAALESYKLAYGDYPQTASGMILLQSLIGKRGPTEASIDGKAVLDLAHFTTFEDLDPYTTHMAEMVDPWGRVYFYAYKSASPWTQTSYVLFSSGPDGVHAVLLSGGRIDDSAVANRDNVYARR